MIIREMFTIISKNLVNRGFDQIEPSGLEDKLRRIKSKYPKVRFKLFNSINYRISKVTQFNF